MTLGRVIAGLVLVLLGAAIAASVIDGGGFAAHLELAATVAGVGALCFAGGLLTGIGLTLRHLPRFYEFLDQTLETRLGKMTQRHQELAQVLGSHLPETPSQPVTKRAGPKPGATRK